MRSPGLSRLHAYGIGSWVHECQVHECHLVHRLCCALQDSRSSLEQPEKAVLGRSGG